MSSAVAEERTATGASGRRRRVARRPRGSRRASRPGIGSRSTTLATPARRRLERGGVVDVEPASVARDALAQAARRRRRPRRPARRPRSPAGPAARRPSARRGWRPCRRRSRRRRARARRRSAGRRRRVRGRGGHGSTPVVAATSPAGTAQLLHHLVAPAAAAPKAILHAGLRIGGAVGDLRRCRLSRLYSGAPIPGRDGPVLIPTPAPRPRRPRSGPDVLSTPPVRRSSSPSGNRPGRLPSTHHGCLHGPTWTTRSPTRHNASLTRGLTWPARPASRLWGTWPTPRQCRSASSMLSKRPTSADSPRLARRSGAR